MNGYIRYFKTMSEVDDFVDLLEALEKVRNSAGKAPKVHYAIRVDTEDANLAGALRYMGAVRLTDSEGRTAYETEIMPCGGQGGEVNRGLPIDKDILLLVGKYSVLDMQVPDRDQWYRKWLRGNRRVIEVTQKGDLDDRWCWRVRLYDGSNPDGDVFVDGMWLRTVEELQVIERVFGGGEG